MDGIIRQVWTRNRATIIRVFVGLRDQDIQPVEPIPKQLSRFAFILYETEAEGIRLVSVAEQRRRLKQLT